MKGTEKKHVLFFSKKISGALMLMVVDRNIFYCFFFAFNIKKKYSHNLG